MTMTILNVMCQLMSWFNHLPTEPPPPLHFAGHLEHEVFVEVGIEVGEVITARRAPPLAPLVGEETHPEKRRGEGDSFSISLLKASKQRAILSKESVAIQQGECRNVSLDPPSDGHHPFTENHPLAHRLHC